MIKSCKAFGVSQSAFAARCDCEGLSGRWSCENRGPVGDSRPDAGARAQEAGWLKLKNRWYCPACQRDGWVPQPPARTSSVLPAAMSNGS